MTVDDVSRKYPLLWHMTDPRNLPGILARGLLSTSELLDLMEVDTDDRRRYEWERRPEDVVLRHPIQGTVVLRDQKPLSTQLLARALTCGTTEDYWGQSTRVRFSGRRSDVKEHLRRSVCVATRS